MSDEDDYLSDKFLVDPSAASTSSSTKTYADRRKEALRRSALKNEQNRKKSRRELEREAREEALNRSLFERAQEEAQESGQQNKALAMMMKMGFKPGQALGKDDNGNEKGDGSSRSTATLSSGVVEDDGDGRGTRKPGLGSSLPCGEEQETEPLRAGIGARPVHDAVEAPGKDRESTTHRKVPLAINEWEGACSASYRIIVCCSDGAEVHGRACRRQDGHWVAQTRRVAHRR